MISSTHEKNINNNLGTGLSDNNPGKGEAETEGSLGVAGQPVQSDSARGPASHVIRMIKL